MTKLNTLWEKVSWSRIAEKIKPYAPALYNLLSSYPPGDEDTFYLARYPYGALLLDEKDQFHLPDGTVITQTTTELQADLGYNNYGLPLGLLLKNQCELFIEQPDTTVQSLKLYRAGDWLGLDKLFNPALSCFSCSTGFQLTAGARTAFLLPPLKDRLAFRTLGEYGLAIDAPPKTLQEHGLFFKKIANSARFTDSWFVEMVFFSAPWIKRIQEGLDSILIGNSNALSQYFLIHASQMTFGGETITETPLWSRLLGEYQDKTLYYYDIVMHAIQILQSGLGQLPGYTFAEDDQAGPFTSLAQHLLSIYESQWEKRRYAPLIMQPTYIHWQTTKIIYSSLNYKQMAVSGMRASFNITHYIDRLEELITRLLVNAKQCQVDLKGTSLAQLPYLQIAFYQSAMNQTEITEGEALFKHDAMVTQWQKRNRYLAYNNHFLRRCIKLTQITQEENV